MERPSYGYSAEDQPDPQTPPVCPRHPDRVSYVRCKRCDRPACPDCQRPTSVGTLCVDCEREISRQQASTRPRNAMGARMGARTPYVTYTVIGLSVLAYLGQMLAPGIVEQLGIFAPFRALLMPWTFFTAGFLHGGILHLALNMYALWIVGQYLEQALGHVRYNAAFLLWLLCWLDGLEARGADLGVRDRRPGGAGLAHWHARRERLRVRRVRRHLHREPAPRCAGRADPRADRAEPRHHLLRAGHLLAGAPG